MNKLVRCWAGSTTTLLLCAVMIAGCSGDGAISPQSASVARPLVSTVDFAEELKYFSSEDAASRHIFVAYASDRPPTSPQAPFPVLYLLHDYLGDAGYFERYSLQALLDDMYQHGEIGRMLVVTVDASNYFGGSYYANSATTGNYAEVLDGTIKYVEANYRVIKPGGKSTRAISGHGMGGYGAMRYALDHPELFGSISSMSGPLSLGDPAASTGLWSAKGLFATVLSQNATGPGDPTLYSKIHGGLGTHYETGNLLAMASSFSPHPLRIFDSLGVKCISVWPHNGKCEWVDGYEWYSGGTAGPNTLVFVAPRDTFGVGVDLPFDSSGNLTEAVWEHWHNADVRTVFAQRRQEDPTLWNGIEIFFDVGLEDEFAYLEQNRDFHATLTQAGIAHTYEEYAAAGVLPATHSGQLTQRLRRIIKFHSDLFARTTP